MRSIFVVEQISCAFCSSRSKADLCESPSGLTTSLLLSSLLSFFPPGLLRLHCMPSTFSPAPLSPESLENPSDQRWVSQKLLVWCCLLASRFLILRFSPDNPCPISHRANPPPQKNHCFHYRDRVTSMNLKEPLLMVQLILKFRGLIAAQNSAHAAASLQQLSFLMAFHYSNHHCHLEIKQRTALWETSWEFEYTWWADKTLPFTKRNSDTPEICEVSVVYEV